MRIGLISDIHGNLPALEAVVAQLGADRIDRLVCLGDVAVGPWPHETTQRLRDLSPEVVLGNWDAWLLDGTRPCPDSDSGRKLLEMGAFWGQTLDAGDLEFIREAEMRVEMTVDGSRLSFFHGSPRSFNEPILAGTDRAAVEGMFASTDTPLAGLGHTHLQMIRRLPNVLLVNPGSVGMPFREWPEPTTRICPWAEYGVVDFVDEGKLTVELHRAAYDAESVVRHVLASGVPHAKWWTDCWRLEGASPGTGLESL